MRVISNTRWTVSDPRTSASSRPEPARRRSARATDREAAGVQELEPAQVEHDPPHPVLGGQAADLLVEGGGAGQVKFSGERDQRIAGARQRRVEGEGGHLDREA